jgi:hypothetical protein
MKEPLRLQIRDGEVINFIERRRGSSRWSCARPSRQKAISRGRGSTLAARTRKNDSRANQADGRSGNVPPIGAHTFNAPQPKKRGDNVNAAISGIGAARRNGLDQRQQVREHDKEEKARKQPPDRLAKAQPARDLGNCRADVNKCRLHARASCGRAVGQDPTV